MNISTTVRNIFKALITSCVFLSAGASAAPTLGYEDGLLTHVSGIMINGKSFNVNFQEGSCDVVFDYCQERFFHFKDASSAAAAASALATQVFGGKDPQGTAFGCEVLNDCWFMTPYATDDKWVYVAAFHNATGMSETLDTRAHEKDATYINVTFASWWTETREVPEPGSIALFSIALAGLGALRRKQ